MTDNPQRNQLLDLLQNMGRDLPFYMALYLNLSRIDKGVLNERTSQSLREVFVPQLKEDKIKIFELGNNDVVVVFKRELQDEISSLLVKIRFLLQEDGQVAKYADLQESGIAVIWDLVKDYGELKAKLEAISLVSEIPTNPKVQPSNDIPQGEVKRKFLTTAMLDEVQKIIAVSDFSSFIRRQPVCAVIGKSLPQRVFEEVYVSIPDMRDSLLPQVDIMHDAWLFLALTETLDRRVLDIISRHDDRSLQGNFSVNINVSTILSDDFLRFDDTISTSLRKTIVLELQLADIFSDMRSFDLARAFARSRGYKICIDGITVDKLEYLNRNKLDCDLMKIIWHPEFGKIMMADEHFMDYNNKAERAKIILCRVDDEKAVEVGNSLGINLYQGRYIQKMLNAEKR